MLQLWQSQATVMCVLYMMKNKTLSHFLPALSVVFLFSVSISQMIAGLVGTIETGMGLQVSSSLMFCSDELETRTYSTGLDFLRRGKFLVLNMLNRRVGCLAEGWKNCENLVVDATYFDASVRLVLCDVLERDSPIHCAIAMSLTAFNCSLRDSQVVGLKRLK